MDQSDTDAGMVTQNEKMSESSDELPCSPEAEKDTFDLTFSSMPKFNQSLEKRKSNLNAVSSYIMSEKDQIQSKKFPSRKQSRKINSRNSSTYSLPKMSSNIS